MKLDRPFYRLPLQFDVQRLRAEVEQFSEDHWRPHPQGYEGNSALLLISVHGRQTGTADFWRMATQPESGSGRQSVVLVPYEPDRDVAVVTERCNLPLVFSSLCRFLDIPYGPRMQQVVSRPLPMSRYTVDPPDPDKWRRNAKELEPALPLVVELELRLDSIANRG